MEIETSLSYALLPPPVVEYWEHLDHRLSNSDQGDLINRIILAQQCMEGCVTDKKPSAKHLMVDWQCLSQISKGELRKLHEKVVERLISQDLVYFAAEFINAGVVKPHQVAVIFAAGTGMNLEQTSAEYRTDGKNKYRVFEAVLCLLHPIPQKSWPI